MEKLAKPYARDGDAHGSRTDKRIMEFLCSDDAHHSLLQIPGGILYPQNSFYETPKVDFKAVKMR